MAKTKFNFTDNSFNNIFPFYILISKGLLIESLGKSIKKIMPELDIHDDFTNNFKILRPHIENLCPQNFNQLVGQLCVIVSKNNSTSLRGQFEIHNNCFLFVGTPWFSNMEDVVEKKLTLHDFAFHDPLLDLLHILKNQDITNAELKELLFTINKQKNELKKANKEIYDMALFSTKNPDLLLRIDFNGKLLVVNPAAENLTSFIYKDKHYKTQAFFKYIIHKIDTNADDWNFEAKSDEKYFSFVCKNLKKEGYINIYGRDISQRKKNEDELKKLSLVASANKSGVVITNPDGTIFWCNSAYSNLTGFSLNEIFGKTPVEIGKCKKSNKDEINKMIDAFFKGQIFEVEIVHNRKNKIPFWSKITGQPIMDSDGKVIQYFALLKDISAEKHTAESLLILSSIAEKNINSVVIFDINGCIEWVNASFVNMTGYAKAELTGYKFETLLQETGTDIGTVTYLKNQISNGLPFDCEAINYTKTKEKYWVRIQGQALRNNDGEIIKYFAVEEDITQRKVFNQQIIESEDRLASLIVNLQSGILLEDENRKILIVNKKFCSMFGIEVEPEVMKGVDCEKSAETSKYFFKNPNHFLARINDILRNKTEVIAEEIMLLDGRIFERSYIPIIRNGKYGGHLWSYDDVTINRKYKESLESEREKYSNIIANMNMGLLEVNNNDIIQYTNQSFCDMSGFSQQDLLQKKASDLFLSTEEKKIIQIKGRERLNGISDSYEIISKNKKGELRYWLVSGAPNYNVNGEIIGSIGVHLDITEQKHLAIQKEHLLHKLEKQNEQLNNYAQIVSHDLKSPLRSIHTLTTWIKEDNDKDFNEQTIQYLKLIEETVEKMDHLIHGILTYSMIESDNIYNELVNIQELIGTILNIIHIPDNIQIKIKNELPCFNANKFRMQQLFQNLVINAVTYIDKPHGLIEIDYIDDEKDYIFSIKDNGPGIAEKHQEKIFKMFQSLAQNKKSTGIGLSIVKRIVDNYNGKIWMESELNIGTTFYVKLPKQLV